MARARAEATAASYRNMAILSAENVDLLKKMIAYRKANFREGWDSAELNCGIVKVEFTKSNGDKDVKYFFGDSSGGHPEDTSTHGERRAWEKAKAWVENELSTGRIISVDKTTVGSELKPCSSYDNHCSNYFLDGGPATRGNPEETLVFKPYEGDQFIYSDNSILELTGSLRELREEQEILARQQVSSSLESKRAQANFGNKATNVIVAETLDKLSFKEKFEGYAVFIGNICESLKSGQSINDAVNNAVKSSGNLLFNGKPGKERSKEVKALLQAKSKEIESSLALETGPAWGSGPRFGGMKGTVAQVSLVFSSGSSIKVSRERPPSKLSTTNFTLDELVNRHLSFLELSPKQTESLKNQLERRIVETNNWNKSHGYGDPLDIAQAVDKFCYYSNVRLSPAKIETLYNDLSSVTSNNVVLTSPKNKNTPK